MIWAVVGVVFVVLGVIGVMILVGLMLPREHSATSRVVVPAPRQEVWDTLADFEGHHTWRSGVTKTERRADVDGKPAWVEHNSFGPLPMFVEAAERPSRMVTRIIDEGMPFGGSWTYELVDADGGTAVRITEDGVVYNPIFRFMSRFVMGHHGTMDQYLKDLAKKFGAAAAPEHVSG